MTEKRTLAFDVKSAPSKNHGYSSLITPQQSNLYSL